MKKTLLFIVLVLGLSSMADAQVSEKKTESKHNEQGAEATNAVVRLQGRHSMPVSLRSRATIP